MSQVNETAPAPRMTRDVYMYRLKAPTSRRSFFRFCALFGALVILTITLVIVRATAYSPTAAVRDYFSALEGRNATALWPIVDPHDGMPDPARSTFAAMLKDSGYTPPSNLTVQSSNANDNQATVTASYQVGSTSRTDVFNLQRDGARLDRVFRPWHITNPTTQLYVNWSYPDAVLAAGQATQSTVGFGQGAPAFELFPGQYTIAIADNPLYTATATAAAPAGDVPLQLQPALKPTVQPEVEKQVAALIAKCTTLLNDAAHGCPYQTNETQSVTATSVAWTINVQPQFAVGFSEGGSGVVVTTTQQGEATPVITYRDSNNVINTLDGQQVSFSVDGSVTAPGGAVTYAYGVGE